jgi:hypothetical protein
VGATGSTGPAGATGPQGDVGATGPAGGGFTGDLAGYTLTDSTNNRILANSSVSSDYSTASGYTGITSGFVTTVPSYVGSVVQPQTYQTVAMTPNANIALQSGYGAGSANKLVAGTAAYTQVWPVTANAMTRYDRVRASSTQLDVILNGKTWGNVNPSFTTDINSTALGAQGGQTSLIGSGQVGHAQGAFGSVIWAPAGGSANVRYTTCQFATVSVTPGTGYTASNIAYARMFGGFVTGVTGNVIIQNAIGLHTHSGWVSSNVSLINNAYALLNEDSRTLIQTNGNVVFTGTSKLGTLHSYNEKVFALGNTSGAITANVSQGPVQTLTATGDITLNTTDITNAVAGTSITLIITQDGTGSRLLTSNLKYAGGSKTLSTTAGAIDVISVFYDGTNYLASLVKGYA